MTLLFPRTSKGPGPCPVCGARHSACTPGEGDSVVLPEVIDQRYRAPWRFRSKREVRKRLPDGRFIVLWPKGMPIPPEEALRQRIVAFEDLTLREQERVMRRVEQSRKNQGNVIATSKGAGV